MGALFCGIICLIGAIVAIVAMAGFNRLSDSNLIVPTVFLGLLGIYSLSIGTHEASLRNFTVISSPKEITKCTFVDHHLVDEINEYEVILRDSEFNKYKIQIDRDDYDVLIKEGKVKTSIENLKKVVISYEEVK